MQSKLFKPKKANKNVGFPSKADVLMGLVFSEARREKNLTQQELANFIGVSASTVASLESGERSVDAATLWQIGTALQIAPSVLFQRWEEKAGPEWWKTL